MLQSSAYRQKQCPRFFSSLSIAAELEEARLLYQLAEIQDLTYNPQDDGFVFSLAKVTAYTDRFHRLNQSKQADQEYKKKHHLLEIPRAAGKAA